MDNQSDKCNIDYPQCIDCPHPPNPISHISISQLIEYD